MPVLGHGSPVAAEPFWTRVSCTSTNATAANAAASRCLFVLPCLEAVAGSPSVAPTSAAATSRRALIPTSIMLPLHPRLPQYALLAAAQRQSQRSTPVPQ